MAVAAAVAVVVQSMVAERWRSDLAATVVENSPGSFVMFEKAVASPRQPPLPHSKPQSFASAASVAAAAAIVVEKHWTRTECTYSVLLTPRDRKVSVGPADHRMSAHLPKQLSLNRMQNSVSVTVALVSAAARFSPKCLS